MTRFGLVSIALISCLGLATPARAAFRLGVVGQFVQSTPQTTPEDSSAATGQGIGYGAVLGLRSSGARLGYELGLFYTPVVTKYGFSTTYAQNKQNYLQIPLLLRYHLSILSVGVGGYYALAMGQYGATPYVAGVAGPEVLVTTPSQLKSDYGLVGSLSLSVPVYGSIRLMLDGRYVQGLKNVSTNSASTAKTMQLQGLAGIGFGF